MWLENRVNGELTINSQATDNKYISDLLLEKMFWNLKVVITTCKLRDVHSMTSDTSNGDLHAEVELMIKFNLNYCLLFVKMAFDFDFKYNAI